MKASKNEIAAFLKQDFPQNPCLVEDFEEEWSVVRYLVDESCLRPGGTVSGPTMFYAADVALFVAVLAHLGIVPLAVTAQMNIAFLRKPKANTDVIAKGKLLKKGRTLLYGEVFVYSEGDDNPIAHATGTYSAPPSQA